MPKITVDQQCYETEIGETVLQCLERNNVAPSSSCRSGICQTCMMRALQGSPPAMSQQGLKENLQLKNYFLPCVCVPDGDMAITYADEVSAPKTTVTLIEKDLLSPVIMRVRFTTQNDFSYQAGQFINMFKEDGISRPYSLASVPGVDDYLEFHIERIPNGVMSNWVFDELAIGNTVKISEANGECYYSRAYNTKNMLLIATGSGLAPVYAVLRDAIENEHMGEIHLYHGSGQRDKLYLVEELKSLANQHDNVFYTPSLSSESCENIESGRANDLALASHKNLKDWRIYLCGNPRMVSDTKRKAFLAGAALNDILADPFEFAK